MRDELIKQLLALVFGGILGVLFKYWYDYKGMVQRELWVRRYDSYKKMFLIAGAFPLYPNKPDMHLADLLNQSEKMRDWFFSEGGLLLSSKTRNKYFAVQRMIQQVLLSKRLGSTDTKIIEAEYDAIRESMSRFRRAMTDDLMSRQRL